MHIHAFQEEILTWFSKNKRDLPWRRTRDPYNILVSEIMLQQTQVPRVIPKYTCWIEKFPSLIALANAPTRDVLTLWSGLGYNRRALYLQKTAQNILHRFDGQFPQEENVLQTFPGVGKYTSRALLCFAFDKQISVVDTNVKKVICLFFFNRSVPPEKIIDEKAKEILPKARAYEWNQALMDYSASVLSKERIPIKKQPAFLGSRRFVRGQIIRTLALQKRLTRSQILKDTLVQEKVISEILEKLQKEGLIVQERGIISFPES